jgi:CRISPR-associated endonuclease Csy4
MNHHVDIDVRPDLDFPTHQLLSALYAKLHRALVAQRSNRIGVSFPGFDADALHLGARLRLHGDLAALSSIMEKNWLTGVRDHVAVALPRPVPADSKHRVVRRVQAKSSPDRLRRRLMSRHDYDEREARQRIPDQVATFLKLPFIQLHSASTGQAFPLFIGHGPLLDGPVSGDFNAYGLSHTATVPWF